MSLARSPFLLRPLLSLSRPIQVNPSRPLRPLSTTLARLADPDAETKSKYQAHQQIRSSAAHPQPGDVVAGAAAGPITERVAGEVVQAEVVSGAPSEMQYRPCRIYKPTQSTMQSAKGKTKAWVLDWDVLPGAGRWENALMGWGSSADYVQGTALKFHSKELAVAFAEKQGWDYQVSTPGPKRIPAKNYSSNYVHVPGKLRIHHTK